MIKTVSLDSRRRASLGPGFEPGDVVVREMKDDMVTFRKADPTAAPLIKPVRTKEGFLMLPLKPARQAIRDAIRADREPE